MPCACISRAGAHRRKASQARFVGGGNCFFFVLLLSIACATQELAAVLADGNGVISSQHMHWFFEAEGSRE